MAVLTALWLLIAEVPALAQTPTIPCGDYPVNTPETCSGRPLNAPQYPPTALRAAVALPDGGRGKAYPDIQLVTGRLPSDASIVAGAVPPGMKVSASGLLVGTPEKAGRYVFILAARDGSTPSQELRETFVLHVRD